MCNQQVQVKVVSDAELPALWVAARGSNAERILLVRESCGPAEAAEGYAATLKMCPVRMLLEKPAA